MSSGLESHLFNLNFTAKQLARQAKKSEKQVKLEKIKLRKAIEAGNKDGARIYAENAIRHQNLYMNYLRLSSRIEAAASRVETAVKMRMVTKSMAGVVAGMDKASKSMDLEKIGAVMDQFEKQFENLDVQSGYMEERIGGATTLSTPIDEVDSLINAVADEYGLDVQMKLGFTPTAVPQPTPVLPVPSVQAPTEQEMLERLAALRS